MRPARTTIAATAALLMLLGPAAARAEGPAAALDAASSVALIAAATTGTPVKTDVPGLGRVSLRLRDNPLVAPDARFTMTGADGVVLDVPEPAIRTLAGSVDGDPHSSVRLTIAPSGLGGYVASRGTRIWIEPDPADPRRTITHGDTPSSVDFGNDTVAAPRHAQAAGRDVNVLGIGSCRLAPCEELTARVILDGDVSYTNLGSDCFGRQRTVLNTVDGIYAMAATQIRFVVSQQNCRTAADLGPTSTPATTLLGNLQRAWTGQGSARSLVFLYVGYEMPGSIVGIAYVPGVCERLDPNASIPQQCLYGYSLGQMVGSIGTLDLRTKVMAHEIGHNFDADHDNTGCNNSGRLMCPSIQSSGPHAFSSLSAGQIRSHAESTIGYLVSV